MDGTDEMNTVRPSTKGWEYRKYQVALTELKNPITELKHPPERFSADQTKQEEGP